MRVTFLSDILTDTSVPQTTKNIITFYVYDVQKSNAS